MTDAELSKELALVLGWKISHVTAGGEVHVCIRRGISRKFRYTDPTVCLPLIEWLGSEHRKFFWYCSPTSLAGPRWACSGGGIIASTLAEAVARAVIAVKGGG